MTSEDIARLAAHGIHFTEAGPELTEEQERIVEARILENIPERELWLHKNPEAMAAVQDGIAQARAGHFVEGPETVRIYRATRWLPGQKERVKALMDRLASGEVTIEQLREEGVIGPRTTMGELIERLKGETGK